MRTGWIRQALRLYVCIVVLFVFAPTVTLALFSFHEEKIQSFPIEGFSTAWYRVAWESRELREGVVNSVVAGLAVGVLSSVLGFLTVHVLCRSSSRHGLFLLLVVTLPALMPLLLSGMALLMYFQRIHLAGNLWAVIIAHVCYASPFAMALIYDPYQRLDVEVEQAARNLGASWLHTILHVVVPQLWPALVGAAVFSFLVSWGEFVLAWFVGGFAKTLPVVIYGMMAGAFNPSLNAVGTLATGASAALLLVVLSLQAAAYRKVRTARLG